MRQAPSKRQHPDDLDLELSRTGESDPGTREHVEECDECRERLEVFKTLSEEASGDVEFVDLPEAIDSDQIARARAQAMRVARSVRRRTLAGWSAAAASTLLIVALGYHLGTNLRIPPQPPVSRDVNGDARVDILDAFELARRIEAGTADATTWDLNGDAVLDRVDVDWLARTVVSLGGGL